MSGGETEGTPPNVLAAANAARLLRDYPLAAELYDEAWASTLDLLNAVISNAHGALLVAHALSRTSSSAAAAS